MSPLGSNSVRTDLDPEMLGPGRFYRVLTSVVVPRPIAWVSTTSAAGIDNLAPHSFFTVASVSPPIVQFTSVGPKDTLRNVRETGEFVVNFAPEAALRADQRDRDRLPAASQRVRPGRHRPGAERAGPTAPGGRLAGRARMPCSTTCCPSATASSSSAGWCSPRSRPTCSTARSADARKLAPLARLGRDEWSTLGAISEIARIRHRDWPKTKIFSRVRAPRRNRRSRRVRDADLPAAAAPWFGGHDGRKVSAVIRRAEPTDELEMTVSESVPSLPGGDMTTEAFLARAPEVSQLNLRVLEIHDVGTATRLVRLTGDDLAGFSLRGRPGPDDPRGHVRRPHHPPPLHDPPLRSRGPRRRPAHRHRHVPARAPAGPGACAPATRSRRSGRAARSRCRPAPRRTCSSATTSRCRRSPRWSKRCRPDRGPTWWSRSPTPPTRRRSIRATTSTSRGPGCTATAVPPGRARRCSHAVAALDLPADAHAYVFGEATVVSTISGALADAWRRRANACRPRPIGAAAGPTRATANRCAADPSRRRRRPPPPAIRHPPPAIHRLPSSLPPSAVSRPHHARPGYRSSSRGPWRVAVVRGAVSRQGCLYPHHSSPLRYAQRPAWRVTVRDGLAGAG